MPVGVSIMQSFYRGNMHKGASRDGAVPDSMQNRGIEMGKANPRNANGNARRKLRARLRAEGRPCHICGLPIDYGLPAGDPWSFEVDELVPVSRGGDPLDYSNVDAAHRICNQRRGNRMDGDEGAKGLPIVRSRLF